MIKKIILGLSLVFSSTLFAQEGTASPYSFYGIGDARFKGPVENRGMGGLGMFADTTAVNFQNPATYSHLKLMAFGLAGTTSMITLETDTQKEKVKRTSLNYLTIGIPIGKFGASFGVMPFSSVGYKISYTGQENDLDIAKRFIGEGGVNRVFAGLAYKVTADLSLGLDLQYNFGKSETEALVRLDDVVLASRTRNVSRYKGFSTNLAAYYQKKWNANYTAVASVVYAPESTITAVNERNVATVAFTANGTEVVSDNVNVEVPDTNIKIPSKLSFGAGFGASKKWFIGLEYVLQGKGNFAQINQSGANTLEQKTGQRISVGGYVIPKYNSFSSYFQRITYRAGFKFENTGLVLNGKTINDNAVTVGLGLPVGNLLSKINVAFEYGKYGRNSDSLIQENYFNISVGLSFCDRWFVRTKYD